MSKSWPTRLCYLQQWKGAELERAIVKSGLQTHQHLKLQQGPEAEPPKGADAFQRQTGSTLAIVRIVIVDR
jgi:hypothetical protein